MRPFIVGSAAGFFAVVFFTRGTFYQKESDRVAGPVKTEYRETGNFDVSSEGATAARLKSYEQENQELRERTLLLSPGGRRRAYYQHKFISDLTEIGNNDYTSLVVEEKGKTQTVFTGDHRLAFFEWLDDKEIAVYQDCGTECLMVYLIETQTGESHRFFMGGGYSWAPNKKYVIAFHDVPDDGISVGDKFGNALFTLRRGSPNTQAMVPNLRAVWSPDSSKIALVIHKEKSSDLELIVLDITNEFKGVLRKNLVGREISELRWQGPRRLIYNSGAREYLIAL